MIAEILHTGKQNPTTGRELADYFNTDIRSITAQIETERRQGQPICANMTGKTAGYFMAGSPEELQQYCNALYRRGGELFKTRRALLNVLEQIAAQQDTQQA